jgi:predicted dehydrogenase
MTEAKQNSVGVGVIGTGTWGSLHARIYQSLPGVKLIGIADKDQDRAEFLAGELGADIEVYSDHKALLENPAIQAISVVVPDHLHKPVILDAVRSEKHVLVEKPFTTRVADARECIEEMKKHHCTYMVNFHLRWMVPFYKAQELIRQGAIGQPRFAYFEQSNTIELPTKILGWAGQSNVLWFLGIHSVDMLQWLFGQRITSVFSRSDKRILSARGVDTEDFFATTLSFADGAQAFLENSWILPDTYPAVAACNCRIVGSTGSLKIDVINNGGLTYTAHDQPAKDVNLFGFNSFDQRLVGSPVSSIGHFVRCVRSGEAPMVSLDDALSSVQIITAALKSARSGQPAEVR